MSELQSCSPSGRVRHSSVRSKPRESKNSRQVVPSRWTWTTLWKGSWMWTFSLSSTSTVEKNRSWLKS